MGVGEKTNFRVEWSVTVPVVSSAQQPIQGAVVTFTEVPGTNGRVSNSYSATTGSDGRADVRVTSTVSSSSSPGGVASRPFKLTVRVGSTTKYVDGTFTFDDLVSVARHGFVLNPVVFP